jgi:hypothetical protein
MASSSSAAIRRTRSPAKLCVAAGTASEIRKLGRAMRLTDLNPRFLRRAPKDGIEYWPEVPTIAEADGIVFLCAKCFAANGGPVGTHSIICW